MRLLSCEVCRIQRGKYRRRKDWVAEHHVYIQLWENRHAEAPPPPEEPLHDEAVFNDYLRWLHTASRVHLATAYNDDDIGEESGEDAKEDAYDKATREGVDPQRGRQLRYMVSLIDVLK